MLILIWKGERARCGSKDEQVANASCGNRLEINIEDRVKRKVKESR